MKVEVSKTGDGQDRTVFHYDDNTIRVVINLKVCYSQGVKNNYKQEQEVNFVGMAMDDFIHYYKQTTPLAMPRATKEALVEFQATHSAIFDEGGLWTIDKHRRRVMDWLPTYRAEV